MKLIVLDLARTITREELMETFRAFGVVTAANIVMDNAKGTSKGFGFVEMEKEEDAMKAIEALSGKKLAGRKIRVRISTN